MSDIRVIVERDGEKTTFVGEYAAIKKTVLAAMRGRAVRRPQAPPWSDAEVAELARLYAAGCNSRAIKNLMGGARSVTAIGSQVKRLRDAGDTRFAYRSKAAAVIAARSVVARAARLVKRANGAAEPAVERPAL